MGIIISIYTRKYFQEFLLPPINNADYSLDIHRNLFGLEKDLSLKLEVVNDIWRICEDDSYRVYTQVVVGGRFEIDHGDAFRIVTTAGEQISMLVRKTETAFPCYAKYDLSRCGTITIGKNADNVICYDFQGLVSGSHAAITRQGGSWVIRTHGANGTYLNSFWIEQAAELHFGDHINIIGLHMVFLGRYLAVDTSSPDVRVRENTLQEADFSAMRRQSSRTDRDEMKAPPGRVRVLYHRSPRNIEKIETEEVEIENPPAPAKSKKQPLLLAIGPSFTMAIPMVLGVLMMMYASRVMGGSSSLFMYSGLVMAISSAFIGVIWATANLRYQNKMEKEEEAHRFDAYGKYLVEKTDEIREKYAANTDALMNMYPEAAVCASYSEQSPELWNRNYSHEDFLQCRLGIGDMPFQAPINIQKKKFTLHPDALEEKPAVIRENFKTLYKVPILVDLRKHPMIGIVGGAQKQGALEIARILAVQIAATHCYTDVKMAFLYDDANSDDSGRWDFARWLPHVWAEDKKVRYVASNKEEISDVSYELTKLFRQRLEVRAEESGNKEPARPHVVLFITDISLIEEELLSKYVFDKDVNLGLTVLILSDTYEHLPNACDYIIQNDMQYKGKYNVSAQEEDRTDIVFDKLEEQAVDRLARRLANIEVQEIETGGEIPNSLTFFEMYGVSRPDQLGVQERWLKNRTYDNIKGLIGQKAGGADCYMDVHEKYHGPHGLVAGTTGSGKSETLQTYMLSLALNYSPDDIGFFIIDYKGGGMANLFTDLPHMVGQISNLSGNQVHRAMVSIKSENRRRQRIFSENGVNNINAYTKMVKNKEATVPVPHLFIVIDEFAELKKEEPDFMRELISVAQVGRSLGVHLVLATQKPAGTVDDNIWSNSKFRLCLRVQDKEDSMDMLHKPDAAYITQAGRCYLQVGSDEVYELFQSGWSGAPYDEALEASSTELAKMLTITGRTETVGGHIKAALKTEALKKWLMLLDDCIEEAAARQGIRLAEIAASRNLLQDFSHSVFAVIAEKGIDYAPGRYNQELLENLICLYAKAESEAVLQSGRKENAVPAYAESGAVEMKAGETEAAAVPQEEPAEGLPQDAQAEGLPQEASGTEQTPEEEDEASRKRAMIALAVMRMAEEGRTKLPAPREKTQLDAVIEYLAAEADREGYVRSHRLWMPVLPERLFLQEFDGFRENTFDGTSWKEQEGSWNLETVIGKLDDPANQAQSPLQISFSDGGHLAVIGSVVSGKSTFIQTLLYAMIMKYTPQYINIYGIDFSSKMMSAFEKAPQVGGIAYEGENERIGKLFHMIDEILEERKKLLRGGNYSQYVQVHGVTLPAILLVIDNYSAFREKTEEQFENQILTLSKEGVSHGIYLVISAGGFSINELPGRIAENMKTCIALQMTDKFAYADVLHTMRIEVVPETGVKGRGLAWNDGQLLEFQTALALDAEDDYRRMERIAEMSDRMVQAWNGRQAKRIPEIPEKPVWTDFETLDEVAADARTNRLLPVGYDAVSADVYSIDLRRFYCYLIAGSVRTGKRNFMKIMILASRMLESDVYIIDGGTDMNVLARYEDLHFIRTADELFDFFQDDLTPLFQARNKVKKELENAGAEDDELFEAAAKEKPVFIYIPDLPWFINLVYADGRGMSGFMETLIRKGRYHNIYFIACLSLDDRAEVMSYQMFSDFAAYHTGIHFGGNTVQNSFMNFDYLPYKEQGEVQRPGIGQLPAVDGSHDVERIVVPLARIKKDS